MYANWFFRKFIANLHISLRPPKKRRLCLSSIALVARSLYRAQKLRRAFVRWHVEQHGATPSVSDYNEFIDGWYILILISDILVILGTIFKIDVQTRQFARIGDFQNSCSFLGVGCLMCYCGILRYLGYFKGYNILVLTISHAMPRVIKFLTCALTLYSGYVICGWLVLGPFNEKFATLTITSETLFSLLNGDDMFNTFQVLKPDGPFDAVFFGRSELLYKIWPHTFFLKDELHIILKRRNLEICEHSRFFNYWRKILLREPWKFVFLLILVDDI